MNQLANFIVADIDLLAARNQMAVSLGFHIILAALGIGLPAITLIAHTIGLRRNDPDALELARRWSKAMAVLFAVGAVSGTILSFEMGMLWPGMMGPYGDVIGLPFTLEGVSFFLEAIFIGIYLYGWKRLSARAHYLSLFPIVAAGFAGSFFIVSANAWMNSPAGFSVDAAGDIVNVDPWAAMLNPATGVQYLHMLLAAYMVTGFLVAGVYAWGRIKGRTDRHHHLGFIIPFVVASIAAPLQIAVGDMAARRLIDAQPAKFAAMELIPKGGAGVPFTVGGIYRDGEAVGAIEIPKLGSLLGTRDPNGVLPGLDQIPAENIPPVDIVHWSFQVMVGIGTALLGLAAVFAWVWWRKKRLPEVRWFWWAAAAAGVGAIIAMETGWITTEVGRQPWIVYGHVRTADAVTDANGLIWSLIAITVTYLGLGATTLIVLRRMSRKWREGDDVASPYGPLESVDA